MRRWPALLCILVMLSAPGVAQVPQVRVPVRVPTLPDTPITDAADALGRTANEGLDAARGYRRDVERLLRTDRTRVARTPSGDLTLRHEFLVLDADETSLAVAREAGYTIVRTDPGDDLAPAVTLLRDDRQRAPERGLRALRGAIPGATVDFHHLYLHAGQTAPQAKAASQSTRDTANIRVGLIDGGVDAAAPALAKSRIHRHGCDGRAVPQRHGTLVATRLVSGDLGDLHAADLWCGARVGGGTLALIDALRWMARERVPVVNISLIGPDNPALRRVIEAMRARGHLFVAAAGNDGPAAPPRFPAAYDGVVAVAAVDAKRRPLPESASGAHIDFCAPGVVDAVRGERGTSFAAPLVAHALARRYPVTTLSTAYAARAISLLERDAIDIGKPGRDTRCGAGLIATAPGA
jgi:subtilisin family serine protease